MFVYNEVISQVINKVVIGCCFGSHLRKSKESLMYVLMNGKIQKNFLLIRDLNVGVIVVLQQLGENEREEAFLCLKNLLS